MYKLFGKQAYSTLQADLGSQSGRFAKKFFLEIEIKYKEKLMIIHECVEAELKCTVFLLFSFLKKSSKLCSSKKSICGLNNKKKPFVGQTIFFVMDHSLHSHAINKNTYSAFTQYEISAVSHQN